MDELTPVIIDKDTPIQQQYANIISSLVVERIKRGWSHRQLASRAMLSPATVIEVESLKPNDVRLIDICKMAHALDCAIVLHGNKLHGVIGVK